MRLLVGTLVVKVGDTASVDGLVAELFFVVPTAGINIIIPRNRNRHRDRDRARARGWARDRS